MHRTTRAAAFGLALALIIPGAAMAATATSSTTATVTVDSVISMTGVPATYNFGHDIPGSILTGPTFTINVTSSETAWQLHATVTNFTSGGNTITTSGQFQWFSNGSAQMWNGSTPALLSTVSPIVEYMKLEPGSGARSGVYTGTVTFTATN
jgi:hypothetical protein